MSRWFERNTLKKVFASTDEYGGWVYYLREIARFAFVSLIRCFVKEQQSSTNEG